MFKNLLTVSAIALILLSCNNKKGNSSNSADADNELFSSEKWALLPFVKIDSLNPILAPGKGSYLDPILKKNILWENKDVFNPAIVNRNGKIYMLYRAQDTIGKPGGTSRIGLAVSTDAVHFTRAAQPVFYPDNDKYKYLEWQGGCEDPRIVEDSLGTYYMTYTAFDGVKARLLVATSTDLLKWKKYGSVFAKAANGKYANVWSKSGSIVSTYKNGKIVATKINGKYWMYWGDKQIWAATSVDLLNWTPIELNADQTNRIAGKTDSAILAGLQIVLPTRPGKFDSDLVESGPPAMITKNGILLIYNSRNDKKIGDTTMETGIYTASQVLFDKNNPAKILTRMTRSFMKPEKPYEIVGQVNKVCFVEGLTEFKNKWYLYYGTADSKIAVAVRP